MNAQLSLGPFCNWFLPSCSDIWSGRSKTNEETVLFAYGARSSLCVANITLPEKILTLKSCKTIFSNMSQITAVKFAKRSKIAWVFVGSNEGNVCVLDCMRGDKVVADMHMFGDKYKTRKIVAVDWIDECNVYFAMNELIVHWNINTGKVNNLSIEQEYEHKSVTCMVCSNCGNKKLAVGYSNGDILVYQLDREDSKRNDGAKLTCKLTDNRDEVCSLAFAWSNAFYSEGLLTCVSRDGFIRIYDIYRSFCVVDTKVNATQRQKEKNWFSIGVIPTTEEQMRQANAKFEIMIGSGNGDVLVIEIPSKPPNGKFRIYGSPAMLNKSKRQSHSNLIFNFAIERKHMIAVSMSLDHQIIVWDLVERKPTHVFHTLMHGIHGVSFSSIDPSLVSLSSGDGIRLLKMSPTLSIDSYRFVSIKSRQKVKVCASVWHPSKENIIAYARTDGHICVTDVSNSYKESVKYTTKPNFDNSKVYSLQFGPSLLPLPVDKNASQAKKDENLNLQKLLKVESIVLYSTHQSGHTYLHFMSSNMSVNLDRFISGVMPKKRSELSWKSDHKLLAIGNEDGSVEIFQYDPLKRCLSFTIVIKVFFKCIFCLKWNSDEKENLQDWLAVSAFDNKIKLIDVNTHLEKYLQNSYENNEVLQCEKTLVGHHDKVTSVSWCPLDGSKLASSSYDKTAIIWDVLTCTILTHYKGHSGCLYFVEWSLSDVDLVLSGGEDNTLLVWKPSKQNTKEEEEEEEGKALTNGDVNSEHKILNGTNETCEDNDLMLNSIVSQVVTRVVDQVVQSVDQHAFTKIKENDARQTRNRDKRCVAAGKKTKKNFNKERKVSLFPVANSIDNCSSKSLKLKDIEKMCERMCGENGIEEEDKDRILTYGNNEDIILGLEKEMDHHEKQGNLTQKHILGVFTGIKATILKAINEQELTADLVASSVSVSREFWKDTCAAYAKQLQQSGDIDLAVMYLVNIQRVVEAIDLLSKNNMFREAIIIAKLKYLDDELIDQLVSDWSDYRKSIGDFEGAAKCLISNGKLLEAAKLLSATDDEQTLHTSSVVNSFAGKIISHENHFDD